MRYKKYFIGMLFACICGSAFSNSLAEKLYDYSSSSHKGIEHATGFIALSNLYLTQDDLKEIKQEYRNEHNARKQYDYEYLLSKRTQEQKYIQLFISNSWNHIPELLENKTNWISIESPYYKQLAHYAYTHQHALELLLQLAKKADGAMLSIISADLLTIKNNNPYYFTKAAETLGLSEKGLNHLIENE